MAFLSNIADYLEDQGRGTVGTNIFESKMPASPGSLIAVYETGGLPSDRYLPTADISFQVMVRATTYAAAKTKTDNIVSDLHQKANSTLVNSGEYFYFIFLQGEPGYIGIDDRGRHEWSINFTGRIRR